MSSDSNYSEVLVAECQIPNHPPSSHEELLTLYCRICGRRTVGRKETSSETTEFHLDDCHEHRSFLMRLHDIDVNTENAEIFPKRICQGCVELFHSGIIVLVKNRLSHVKRSMSLFDLIRALFIGSRLNELRLLQRKFPVADFWAHSSDTLQGCHVCQDSGSGVDASTAASYNAVIGTSLPPNKKLKTVVAVSPVEGEVEDIFQITDIKTGTITVEPSPPPTPLTLEDVDEEEEDKPAIKRKCDTSQSSKIIKMEPKAGNSNPWPVLNELLGKNHKYRADKLSEILNFYRFEAPKVLSDLRSSGIDYQSNGGKTHFVKDADFRRSLNRCLALLGKLPTLKKSLILFRALTDAASDGNLSALSHVGITVDLDHPNLSFLLRQIRVKPNVVESEGKGKQLKSPINRKPCPKSKKNPETDMSGGCRVRKGVFRRTPDGQVNKTRVSQLLSKLQNVWPANRQLRADIVREVILDKVDSAKLLAEHGIVFDAVGGGHHLKALDRQRKVHKKQGEQIMERLNNDEWATLMSQVIYDLMHPEDTLTLRIVGLFIDPLSTNAPLYFRMLFGLKKALLSLEDSGLSKQIMNTVESSINTGEVTKIKDDKLIAGLVTLLYCDPKDAKKILLNSRSNRSLVNTSVNTLSDIRRDLDWKNENKGHLDCEVELEDDVPLTAAQKRKLSRSDDVDADYVPGRRGRFHKSERGKRTTPKLSTTPIKLAIKKKSPPLSGQTLQARTKRTCPDVSLTKHQRESYGQVVHHGTFDNDMTAIDGEAEEQDPLSVSDPLGADDVSFDNETSVIAAPIIQIKREVHNIKREIVDGGAIYDDVELNEGGDVETLHFEETDNPISPTSRQSTETNGGTNDTETFPLNISEDESHMSNPPQVDGAPSHDVLVALDDLLC